MSIRHDVVIVGGGLVGASLAIALDRLNLSVGLVEAIAAGEMPVVFDQRNLSFAAATINALTALGVMARLRAPTGSIQRIHVSRQGDFGRVRLAAADYGRQAFGQVVVARDFGEALEARLGELANLTRYRPAKFVGFGNSEAGMRTIRVAGAEGEYGIGASLVVAADGTRSGVREALGIGIQEHDYQQTLFVTRMRADRTPDGTAYERLRDDGPTAVLPRGDGYFGVVHGVAREQADAVAELDEAAWVARIQQAVGWRMGRFLSSDERSRYRLIRVVADAIVGERAVLMGNAAQTIHPVGAQGFNLGLRDALTLAEQIEQCGGDPGSEALLRTYTERRGEDRKRTLAFSDGLARLTSNPSPLLRPLRSLGIVATGHSDALRSWLAGGAMGFRGHVPALCREATR